MGDVMTPLVAFVVFLFVSVKFFSTQKRCCKKNQLSADDTFDRLQ